VAEQAYAYVTLIPVAKGFQKAIANEMGGVNNVGQSAGSKFSKAFNGALKGALAVGAVVAGTALAGVGVAVTKGFGRLTAIENARNLLAGIGNDAETVETVMGNALNSVRGTAFGLDSAAGVAASAVASGIKPGEDLERILGIVADTAAVAGTSMEDIGTIMGKVTTTNKASNSELQQLAERGIPVYQLLADQIGVTSEEIFDMASDGKIDLETLSSALEDSLGGAALKAGETTEGAMANVGAAISRVGGNLISGVFAELPGFFGDIIEALGPVEELAKDLGAELAASLRPAMDKLVEILPDLLAGIIPLIPLLIDFLVVVLDLAVKALPLIVDGIAKSADALVNLISWVKENKDGLIGWSIAIGAGALVLAAFSTVAKIKAVGGLLAMMKTTKLATAAQRIFNFTMAANPIGIIIAAVAALVAGLIYFFTQTEAGKEAWASFMEALGAIWEGMKIAWDNLMVGFNDGLDWFKELPGKISAFFSGAGKWLLDAGKKIMDGLLAGLKFVWKLITFWYIEMPIKIIGFFAKALTWLVGAGKNILRGMWDGIKIVWALLTAWIKSIRGWIVGFLSTAVKWLVTAGKNVIRGMWDGLKIIWALVSTWVKGRKDAVINLLSGALKWLYNIGKDIITGLWDGLKNAWTSVSNWVSDKVSWIIDSFTNALDIQSPSRVFYSIGKNIGDGLVLGMDSTADKIDSTMSTMMTIPKPNTVSATNSGSQNSLNYYAASNSSLDSEQALFQAMRRARVVAQW